MIISSLALLMILACNCQFVWCLVATALINIRGVDAYYHILGRNYKRVRRLMNHKYTNPSLGGIHLHAMTANGRGEGGIINEDYIQRFGNVAKLYPGYRSPGSMGNSNYDILHKLLNTHVCIIGLGGVGSWVVEALARSGIGRLSPLIAHHL